MITKLTIRNFKQFDEAVIDLNNNVVLIGPNNAGKTTALQALALWDIGYKAWVDKRGPGEAPLKRPGIAVNRRDLISIPIPEANLLWKDRHTRVISKDNGKQSTQNIRIDIIVEGISDGKAWECGLEFDYANEEAFHCRPLRLESGKTPRRMPVPELKDKIDVAFLPPMSGLAEREFLKQQGEIGVLLGQGQTAEVLRNLCYRVFSQEAPASNWHAIITSIRDLFGVELLEPIMRQATSEITLSYKDQSGIEFDISSSGRGLQQTLMLLAHLYANPRSVLLLDEPDAHLEILRQRQIYSLITDTARAQQSQIIAASHSEVVLNEAATKDTVIAFVGKPHRLMDRGTQVRKALKDIGFDQYYQAEQKGWVLYLEDATDLAILQAFAELLEHPAKEALKAPFVHYVATNLPSRARDHFHGIREAKPDFIGIALFDRIETQINSMNGLEEMMWRKREIENYFNCESVLKAYAESSTPNDLFALAEQDKRKQAMADAIEEVKSALETFDKPDIWSNDVKASDDVLEPIFKSFSRKMNLPLVTRKRDFHELVSLMEKDDVDKEVSEKLDRILELHARACPAG
jgi:ABC-type transport system involved in cytochrome c biogenesis ATPase subunit